ncbi:sulfatase-like hydrolase/transferase [Azonexus sp.]|jgi:MFS family permease|uniref:sulfatase-like hydrolase/transferase n=1 Tax=Azonexus sp. TaxID=1872668 RepID=UPI00282B6D05|nr:sulfatase-like hydrolase/transferase [Azonexus sp.]MDR1995200.1 sulfatase-like hydrolase/transferase [Azonexus sp.]
MTDCFHILHTRLEGQRGYLYALITGCLFLLFLVTLPAILTGLEDNVDGMTGYHWFYVAFVAVSGLCYGVVAYLAYRYLPDIARSWLILLGFTALLAGLIFAFAFPSNAGVLDNFLFAKPEGLALSLMTLLVDGIVIAVSFVIALLLLSSAPQWAGNLATALVLGSAVLSLYSLYTIDERVSRKSESAELGGPRLFHYSPTGKNVLVLFLDGAMSGYMPDIIDSSPGLTRQFSGFTWYSNVVSPGNRTITGVPALFGGFDYTVAEINKRQGPLQVKVSDAYRIFVDNFSRHDYTVLYSDPLWFGFQRKGDCELFNDQYEKDGKGRCIHSIGKLIGDKKERVQDRRQVFLELAKQYLAIALYKIAPTSLRSQIYDGGNWLGLSYAPTKKETKYLDNYFSLDSLADLSDTSATRNTFTFLANELTRATLFVKPDCLPEASQSTEDPAIKALVTHYGAAETAAIYQTTGCAVQALGRYMEWMKEKGIYDNTMIVIVSDHGWTSKNPLLKNVKDQTRFSMFQSFLMVKPFATANRPLRESKEFISSANVPGMLCDLLGGCLDQATGKTIRHMPLTDPVTLFETPWQPSGQNSDTYVVDAMYQVSGDITNSDSWQYLE